MAVLLDYLDWRGDLSFQADPANEADYYLISKIGCPDLTGLVPSDGREVPLPEAVAAFRAQSGNLDVSLGVSQSPQVMESFYRLPGVPRYQPLMLSGFRRNESQNRTEQFSALTVRIPGCPRIITFRGTDDTILAWKENFDMAVINAVPAQEDALRYLLWAVNAYEGDFVLCGHSKGGNLATYAASMLPPNLQERILSVYSFDGPGFKDAFLEEEGYRRILPKLRFLVPQNSVIGMLLSSGKEPEIVACNCYGVRSHDGFTWEVRGRGFVRAGALNPGSAMIKKAMNETLMGMSLEDRKAFVDDFFQIMTSTGAFTLTDLTEVKLLGAMEIISSLGRSREVQKFASGMISNALSEIRSRREAMSAGAGKQTSDEE